MSLNTVISRELRSLFLPCIGTDILDAASELYFASTILCNTSNSSNNYEQKYIGVEITHFDKKALNPLQSVILCLGPPLK